MNQRQKASEAISKLTSILEIDSAKLLDAEDSDQLLLYIDELPKASIDRLDEPLLRSFFEAFQSSARIDFMLSGLEVAQFNFEADLSAQLEGLADSTKHSSSATFQLQIKKDQLVRPLSLPVVEGVDYRLFFYADNFEKLAVKALNNPKVFEEHIWGTERGNKSVVVLLNSSFSATGEFVSVLGDTEAEISQHVLVPSRARVETLAQQFKSCKNSVKWEKQWLHFSTPAYYQISSSNPDHRLQKGLAGLATNVSLLFTADRVRELNGETSTTFATERSRCDIPFVLESDLNNATFDVDHCREVLGLANWAYGDKWEPDRLRFVQLAVANALNGEKNRNAMELLWRAKGIRENLEWQWKSFMAERVDQYSAEERALESEVAETVERVDSQVTNLIKGISGTVLGAVGVFIGTFIAAAFKDKFNEPLFAFGIWGYAFYVILFPGLYSMWHTSQAYRATMRLYEGRKKRLEHVLGEKRTRELIEQNIDDVRCRFKTWYVSSILALLGILVLCWVVKAKVPEFYKPNKTKDNQTAFVVDSSLE